MKNRDIATIFLKSLENSQKEQVNILYNEGENLEEGTTHLESYSFLSIDISPASNELALLSNEATDIFTSFIESERPDGGFDSEVNNILIANNLAIKVESVSRDLDLNTFKAYFQQPYTESLPFTTESVNGHGGNYTPPFMNITISPLFQNNHISLVVEESNLNVNASFDFSQFFITESNYGSHGEGSYNSEYTLDIHSGDHTNSGLIDTASNEAILLFNNNGVIEGRISDNTVVFTVSVDSNGTITLDQSRALKHADVNNHDESISLPAANLIQLTRTDTITSGNGDSAQSSATLDIGQAISFKDDGPSIQVELAALPLVALVVDESDLNTDASADFSQYFVVNADAGADGQDTLISNYALNLNGANGIDSGLVDTASNEAVLLYNNNGVIEGRISDNTVVFTVSVDNNGVVELDQLRSIKNNSDSSTLNSNDLIQLTRTDTITDGDGDSAQSSATLDIGQTITFKDDGPSIEVELAAIPVVALVVDESDLNTDASADFSQYFVVNADAGADGQDSLISNYALNLNGANGIDSGLVDTASNEAVLLYNNNGVIEGRISDNTVVFTVAVDNNGVVELDQLRSIKNNSDSSTLNSNDLIQLTRTDTITDGDGDSAQSSATLDIGQALTFKDGGPSIEVELAAIPLVALVVDESDLNTDASADFSQYFVVNANAGADGQDSLISNYALNLNGANGIDSGLVDTASNEAVLLYNNNGVIEGRISDNTVVFTVAVDNNGVVELDQLRAIKHADVNNHDESISLPAADLIQLTRTDTITDGDGDSAQSSATLDIGQAITFKDDGPSIQIELAAIPLVALVVDESDLNTDASADFSQYFVVNANAGADGQDSLISNYVLNLNGVNGIDSGLVDTASNEAVLLYNNNGVIEGRISDNTVVFTVSVDNNGVVELDQLRALKHADVNNHDESISLPTANLIQLTRTDTITDGDGDSAQSSATLDIGQALTFKDDGPSIQVELAAIPLVALVVDESDLNTDASANFSQYFVVNANTGADGQDSLISNYALNLNGANGIDSGLVDTASNEAVLLYNNNGVIEGRISDNTVVFTVSVDNNGVVELDQLRALKHADVNNHDESISLPVADLIQLTRTDTITNGDGDSAQSSATLDIGQALTFKDDGPSIQVELATIPVVALVVDESDLHINASADFSQYFVVNANAGADGQDTLISN